MMENNLILREGTVILSINDYEDLKFKEKIFNEKTIVIEKHMGFSDRYNERESYIYYGENADKKIIEAFENNIEKIKTKNSKLHEKCSNLYDEKKELQKKVDNLEKKISNIEKASGELKKELDISKRKKIFGIFEIS